PYGSDQSRKNPSRYDPTDGSDKRGTCAAQGEVPPRGGCQITSADESNEAEEYTTDPLRSRAPLREESQKSAENGDGPQEPRCEAGKRQHCSCELADFRQSDSRARAVAAGTWAIRIAQASKQRRNGQEEI